MAGRLEGKAVIITGATSGIGEATARRFAEEGARLLIAGRTVSKGESLARELGERVVFEPADVTREADIARLVDSAVKRFGRLDCMFNNAGAVTPCKLESVTEQEVRDGLQLLVGSVIFGMKHAARVMKDHGGSIINNASVAAHRFGQGDLLYSAAKAAVAQLTHLAGVELGAFNIRVNAISPGAIATPIFWGGSARAGQLSNEENRRKQAKLEQNLARATPLPRSGQSLDIANAALFLASDEGSFVNSHDLVVDGGRIWQFHERANG
ncbi:NAD(P)-dependent dehydrogenase (short-subunit alcohol dehydrogenase family) [Povalibacter uvarum]|uniref:NAD(P)-dependent dehydrogenase (Short-subunit alcohol dehydrogenase family) n=1 Tax=Povalibacter uvarum TaxID=732238 RepID=A0A841HNE3_9GAMM|nr:SDR family oxidoreductase [Povalibacter uvarum]MBB6093465.1 NAD(P)-dependent dehydrogenase (short-subunit alcohol dehydrogenase family) [Povalibacter uvarum]